MGKLPLAAAPVYLSSPSYCCRLCPVQCIPNQLSRPGFIRTIICCLAAWASGTIEAVQVSSCLDPDIDCRDCPGLAPWGVMPEVERGARAR
jgi:hypothetical protein